MASPGLLALVAIVIGLVTYFRYIKRYDVHSFQQYRPARSKKHRARKQKRPSLKSPSKAAEPPSSSSSCSSGTSTVPTTRSSPKQVKSDAQGAKETTASTRSAISDSFSASARSALLEPNSIRDEIPGSLGSSRSMCDCGSDTNISDDRFEIVRTLDAVALMNPTTCTPIDYEEYKPESEGLLALIDQQTPSGLCEDAQKPHPLHDNMEHLEPFKPILHAIMYAQTHAKMIHELDCNYSFIESS
ncbi:hypothetical protein L596_015658 [Steinernema carpocapsae]|uniref:Uncharacterized protein n=1 Tax=Steinernema carpocapsae TaxID=34508 RepID=A0A4U5NGL3_STECR|nr:hypothetical protein L596_015658 [Steinernema carpocapsae]